MLTTYFKLQVGGYFNQLNRNFNLEKNNYEYLN